MIFNKEVIKNDDKNYLIDLLEEGRQLKKSSQ